ncbi:MAG TPA: flagellar basal body P-ring protein FlgI [Anaerohalosphaeraceae bacterium]|nr:flagellar basal body P-ring protein FlgI [Anaerohalosphaeraceae bacterium]HOM75408.1 flagellar basal body P-ring protein FlgI [Anaerohalosphaeraceae bacterium]HPC63032.1 flagellar basal body P-ring protein FlgI [Anaerohalosphaeraceae bacterium]HPO69231.1 flagellar basal body P-ring protein FlgI [Anaerohalosphaeraceae bacterium]HRS71856.1 flagellar basal body P-ring protein FlgI [Anaerohalosphaeraceae bacterium]
MKLQMITVLLIGTTLVLPAGAERIKDIVDIQGIRGNTLEGIGLVVGLANTGDSTLPSRQMLTNILRRSGLVFSSNDLKSGNIAIVSVTAELGPFAREGSRLDVDVSSIGDAKNLQGGTLLMTELYGADGQVYAVARGTVFIGGWSAAGENASITKNHPTVGRIPGGAIVERAEVASFVESVSGNRFITLNLRNSDFTTAENISRAINEKYPNCAVTADAGTVRVAIPSFIGTAEIGGFIVDITQLEVAVDTPAVVVINERTGTIVVGKNVGISAVAISQGGLVIKVKEQQNVSQPTAPFTEGATTQVVNETLLGVEESDGYLVPMPRVVTVEELAKALNAIGATPRDMIAIFNALKKAGALQANLEIM